jgi:DNA-binding FadR family transcriptional regulator
MALNAAIAEWLSMQRKVSLRVPGVEARAYKSHEEIYGAIVVHQPEAAWLAMDLHLRDVIESFQKGSQHGYV